MKKQVPSPVPALQADIERLKQAATHFSPEIQSALSRVITAAQAPKGLDFTKLFADEVRATADRIQRLPMPSTSTRSPSALAKPRKKLNIIIKGVTNGSAGTTEPTSAKERSEAEWEKNAALRLRFIAAERRGANALRDEMRAAADERGHRLNAGTKGTFYAILGRGKGAFRSSFFAGFLRRSRDEVHYLTRLHALGVAYDEGPEAILRLALKDPSWKRYARPTWMTLPAST